MSVALALESMTVQVKVAEAVPVLASTLEGLKLSAVTASLPVVAARAFGTTAAMPMRAREKAEKTTSKRPLSDICDSSGSPL
jgi:hypothetical protein